MKTPFTWTALNAALRECSEDEAQQMLLAEKNSSRRGMFILRIHSRINRLRRTRERKELLKKLA